MSSLKNILEEWSDCSEKQNLKVSVENWLNTNSIVGQEFVKNLQSDCALNDQAASELAELLSNADTLTKDGLKNKFYAWEVAHRVTGPEYKDASGRILARVVSEYSLNAALEANDEDPLTDKEKINRRAIANKLSKLKLHPSRDVERSVWATWEAIEYPCESMFLLYNYRKNNPSPLGADEQAPMITAEEIISCLALSKDYLNYTLYILYYKLPNAISLHVPTVADAGFNNIDFLPKKSSEEYGKTRAKPPCPEGVHANSSLNGLQYVEIIHPVTERVLSS